MNALKEYLRTNKIKNSTLAAEMGVTTVTMCNAIAEKAEFRAGNLKVLLDYCVPFEIIRERMKRLYDEKRIAEKYGNGNGNAETETEIEAEFEAETEKYNTKRKQNLLSTNEKRLSTSNSLCSNLFIFLFSL